MPLITGTNQTLTPLSSAGVWFTATGSMVSIDVRSVGAVRIEAAVGTDTGNAVPVGAGATGATGPVIIAGPIRFAVMTTPGDQYRIIRTDGDSVSVAASQ